MKICEIIHKGEYLSKDISEEASFSRLVTSKKDCDPESVLLLTEKTVEIKEFEEGCTPLAVICGIGTTLPEGVKSIRVENPRRAISYAYYRYERLDIECPRIIGITGTNGKTSTARMLTQILNSSGYRVGFIGTGTIEICGVEISEYTYSMTTPDPDRLYRVLSMMRAAGCNFVVMEVSSHALALEKVAPIEFEYGVFTNFSDEHLDFHGKRESYLKSKLKLLSLSKTAVFNIDDRDFRGVYEDYEGRKLSVGALFRGDVYATEIKDKGLHGIDYFYHGRNFIFKAELRLAGIYNVYNSMLAASVATDIGCVPCSVKKALSEISVIPGRFEIINSSITVIIDYAHTSDAFDSFLRNLSRMKEGRRITVVFGCGGERDREKRPRMAEAAERYADRIIVTTDNPRREDVKDIISDIIRGFTRGGYEIIENRREAIKSAILGAETDELVAIIGKGAEKYTIDKDGYHQYDESMTVREAIEERKTKTELCE